MKIGLISRISPDTKAEDLQGYNQVVAFHLARELMVLGIDAVLVPDDVFDDPDFNDGWDALIAISAVALRKLGGKDLPKLLETEGGVMGASLVEQIKKRCRHLFWMSDGPLRSIIPWGSNKADCGAYVGMGADESVCFPEQLDKPVVLFNAWNSTIDQGKFDDPMLRRQLAGSEFASQRGVEIWGANCKPTCATRYVGKDSNPNEVKLGYVKWLDVCAAYRQSWIFLDGTPKVIELGRVEAACCGGTLIVPNVVNDDPYEGLHLLPQLYWDEKTDLGVQIMRAVEQLDSIRPFDELAAVVRKWFSWKCVAVRVASFLEDHVSVRGPREKKAKEELSNARDAVLDGGWDESSTDKVPGGKWVEYPILVPPRMLRWQNGARGPELLEASVHYRSALEMIKGTQPDKTEYAARMRTKQAGVHGKPGEFFELIKSIEKRWSGPPLIAGINGRGEIVIHDGWHRSAAALAIGLDVVPVAIHFRDEKWIAFRHALKALNGGHKLYQPIDHPDLVYWPAWRRDTPKRIDLIADYLTRHGVKLVLDLGCHAGVITCGLARRGFRAIGVDQNEKAITAANMLRGMSDIGSSDASFTAGSLPTRADAVVALSMINHALIKDVGRAAFLLKECASVADHIMLDCPAKGDPVGGDTEWSDPGRFVDWTKDTIGGLIGVLGTPEEQGIQRHLFAWRRD